MILKSIFNPFNLLYIPAANLLDSFVKNVFCGQIIPIPGTVLRCDMAMGFADHTGIYLGNGEIAELRGNGEIQVSSSQKFKSLKHFNSVAYIYVACKKSNTGNMIPLGNEKIATRARKMIGHYCDYKLFSGDRSHY